MINNTVSLCFEYGTNTSRAGLAVVFQTPERRVLNKVFELWVGAITGNKERTRNSQGYHKSKE